MRRKKTKEKSAAVQTPQTETQILDEKIVEKDFFDILNYQRKQSNNLLGYFSSDGSYKISQELVAQLLLVPKKFDRFDNNLVYVASVMNEFVLNFKIELDMSPTFCTAKLFLIEMEAGFEKEDTKHTTELDAFTETYNFDFRKDVFEKWNVFYEDETIEKNDFLWDYLHLQMEEFLFNKEITEILSQIYILRMMQLLGKLGAEGEKLLLEFEKQMGLYAEKSPDLISNFTFQKQLLDSMLMKENLFKKILANEEGKKILESYAKPLKNIRDKTIPTIISGEKREEKKPEKKTDPKSASKPKKKSGGKSSPVKPFVFDWGSLYPKKDDKAPAKGSGFVPKTPPVAQQTNKTSEATQNVNKPLPKNKIDPWATVENIAIKNLEGKKNKEQEVRKSELREKDRINNFAEYNPFQKEEQNAFKNNFGEKIQENDKKYLNKETIKEF